MVDPLADATSLTRTPQSVPHIRRLIFSLLLFGLAFGYVEGAVVVYLRAIGGPIRAAVGITNADLFPLIKITQLRPEDANLVRSLARIEMLREAATLIMLAAVAAAATRNFRSWLAAFAIVFGAWDLAFYATLKALIGWPASLMTWDLLFLLPVPWTGPVLAPIVAASLVIGGIIGLARAPRMDRISWVLLAAGGAIVFAAFVWNWRYIESGGYPRGFPWLVFGTGEFAGVAGFARARLKIRKDV